MIKSLMLLLVLKVFAYEDLEHARFEATRRADNAHVLLQRLAEFDDQDVLLAACDRETRLQKIPVACLKLYGPTPELTARCVALASRGDMMPRREEWNSLPKACRDQVAARKTVLEYKSNGRVFE